MSDTTRASYAVWSEESRNRLLRDIKNAPLGFYVDCCRTTVRSIEQNKKMWAMLSDFGRQVDHHSLKLSSEDWKLIFLDALGKETRLVPNLYNSGVVNLNTSSSSLRVSEMSDFIELIYAEGTQRNVNFKDVPFPTDKRSAA